MTRLPPADREDVARLRHPADRLSTATGRAAVRWLLSGLLDCEPQDVALVRGEHGKPLLDRGRHGLVATRLFFSVSHIRGLVAVALSNVAVGVDVEAVRGLPDMEAIAREFLAPDVLRSWEATACEAERSAMFYRYWTLGEAFIKATGEGLSQGLQGCSFSAAGQPSLLRVDNRWGPPHRWAFGVF